MTNPTSLPPTEPDTTTHPVLLVDYDHLEPPIARHGGDITILPDPDFTVGYNTTPIRLMPDSILYTGSVVVPVVPLDGIARLRRRLGR